MEFITKNFRKCFNLAEMDYEYQKPGICPHCGIACDAHNVGHYRYSVEPGFIVFLVLRCTSCEKLFTATYKIENQESELLGITPKVVSTFNDPLIEKISPRFIEMYNQSLRAKDNDDLDLAAIGYRSAIEILIKDYAINELDKSVEEVSNKPLNKVIADYLPDEGFVNSADVIRYLGNDYTHYERKYPELDFSVIEEYMSIFISLIRTKLLIAHPPVSRHS